MALSKNKESPSSKQVKKIKMLLPSSEIKKIVFASILSLSVYGVISTTIDWGSEKCPWDTKKVKFVVMVCLALISIYVLFGHFRHRYQVKNLKYTMKYGPDAVSKISAVRS